MKTLLIVFVLSNGTDLTTTELALNTGKTREVNALMRERNLRVPVKIGATAGLTYFLFHYHKKHPKVAKSLAIFGSAAYGAASVNNYRVYRKGRR